jgi:hypothetical protein
MQELSLLSWCGAALGGVASSALAKWVGRNALDRFFGGLVGRSWRRNPEEIGKAIGGIVGKLVDDDKAWNILFTDGVMDALRSKKKLGNLDIMFQEYKGSSRSIKAVKEVLDAADKIIDGEKAFHEVGLASKMLRGLKGMALAADTVFGACGGILLDIGLTVVCNTLSEYYRRWRHNRHAIMIMPLKYKGKAYTAGINGHRGIIYGEKGGTLDNFFDNNVVSQMVDSLIFSDDKNPSLKKRLNDEKNFLSD